MSYQVNTDKLITIANLRNFYERFWDEMNEEHNNMMGAFLPGGAAVTTNADIDEALFNIIESSSPALSACPGDPKYGEHSWESVEILDEHNNVTGHSYTCSNPDCGIVIDGELTEPADSCGLGNHTWIDMGSGNYVCDTCGYEVNNVADISKY